MCPMVGLLVLRVVLDLPSRANGKRSAYVNAGDIRDLGSIPGSRITLVEDVASPSSILAWKIT